MHLANSMNICNCRIKVYEKCKLIIDDYTDELGNYYLDVPFGTYKLIVSNCKLYPKIQCFTLLVNNYDDKLIINFNNRHPITIKLVDQNYKGLPIDKGRMIFWIMDK